MPINKNVLSPDQLIYCESVRADFVNAARKIPFLKLASTVIASSLTLVTGFEIALFLEIFSYISEGEESALSSKMLGLTGFIALITAHIIAIRYKDSKAIGLIRNMVFLLMPMYVLGAGFLYASGLFENLMTLFENGDLEAEAPLLPAYFQEYILPNAVIILTIGMMGFTAFCIFSASYLFGCLKSNVEKIIQLASDRDAANSYMQRITVLQSEHVGIYSQFQTITEQLSNIAVETAHKIAMEISQSISTLESWIMQRELFPDDEIAANEFATLLNEDDDQTKLMKKMSLPVLKSYRDKLKDLDKKAILAIIYD